MNYPLLSDDLLLSLLWVIPLAGSLITLAIPKGAEAVIKGFALGVTLLTGLFAIIAFARYVDPSETASAPLTRRAEANLTSEDVPKTFTREERALVDKDPHALDSKKADTAPGDLVIRHSWIPQFKIEYYLGLDGISLSLILLTALVNTLACLASFSIEKQVKGYFSLFLLLTSSMMGVFLALDMFLFYVFFEIMLLPMYFLIAIWGGENREYAAIKFLLYTLFGSVFILVAILILYFWTGEGSGKMVGVAEVFNAHSFDAVKIARVAAETPYYGLSAQCWVFMLFLTGFLVKLPSFPFHTWLPDAHVQAPTPISMILAGVLLKIGGYGLIRLAWPLAPAGAYYFSYFVATLGVVSIIYGALAAMAQTDFKKLVAYSSVSHMGYVTLGLAVITLNDPRYYAYGVNGAMFMQIAHGITSTGMFFLVGVIYERAHTRDLNKLGGLMNAMPIYAAVSFLIFFGSMGLPGLCGFVAEAFVILAAFNSKYYALTVVAAASVVLTAGYILWTLQRVFLGRGEQHHHLHDLNLREMIIAAPLVILTVVLGICPSLLLNWMSPSVTNVINGIVSSPTARAVMNQKASGMVAMPPPVAPLKVAQAVRGRLMP